MPETKKVWVFYKIKPSCIRHEKVSQKNQAKHFLNQVAVKKYLLNFKSATASFVIFFNRLKREYFTVWLS
jgi:hypothetical protein